MACSVTRKANLYLFGIGIGRVTQNDYHQYKIRLKRRLTQTLVFTKLSYNTCLRFWEEIWYHEKKCTQRTFTVSKTITQIRTDDWAKDERNTKRQ